MADVTEKYCFKFPRRQNFSFPFYLMSYITECPTTSPFGYQKLQQTCKHFFGKKKIVVVEDCIYQKQRGGLFFYSPWIQIHNKPLPIGPFQYWFTNLTSVSNGNFSIDCHKIYRLTIDAFYLTKEKLLSLTELNLFLSNKLQRLYLKDVDFRDDDGNSITPDYILTKAPNLTELTYYNYNVNYSNDILKKMNSIKACKKLRWFHLAIYQTSEEIKAEILFQFLKHHVAKSCDVKYIFKLNSQDIKHLKIKLHKLINGVYPGKRKPIVDIEEI